MVKLGYLASLAIISILLSASSLTNSFNLVEAKSKSKLAVTFFELGSYTGHVKVKLYNLNRLITLLKTSVDIGKLKKTTDCSPCKKTFSFDPKSSTNGNPLKVTFTSDDGGSWVGFLDYKKGTMRFDANLEEISCDAWDC